MPRHHSVDERPERPVLEQLHGARDDARVDGAVEDDGAGVENQVEDEGTVVDGSVMGWGIEGVFVLGRTLLALRECFGTDTPGMRTGLIVESGGVAATLTASRASMRSSSCYRLQSRQRDLGFIFLK